MRGGRSPGGGPRHLRVREVRRGRAAPGVQKRARVGEELAAVVGARHRPLPWVRRAVVNQQLQAHLRRRCRDRVKGGWTSSSWPACRAAGGRPRLSRPRRDAATPPSRGAPPTQKPYHFLYKRRRRRRSRPLSAVRSASRGARRVQVEAVQEAHEPDPGLPLAGRMAARRRVRPARARPACLPSGHAAGAALHGPHTCAAWTRTLACWQRDAAVGAPILSHGTQPSQVAGRGRRGGGPRGRARRGRAAACSCGR